MNCVYISSARLKFLLLNSSCAFCRIIRSLSSMRRAVVTVNSWIVITAAVYVT